MEQTGQYVGTPETEVIIGQAQTKLAQSLKSLEGAWTQVQNLPNLLSDYTLRITAAENKLKQLEEQYNENKRKFEVELELKKKQDIGSVVEKWLAEQSETAIQISELNTLRGELADAKKAIENEVKKEVAIVTNSLNKSHEAALSIREAQYNQKEAENKATITSLTNQITALQKDVESWRKQLDDERRAGIERAKASAIGAVNVTGTGK